ncbi:hypothetical protein NL676_030047 [Syzygium grande]|nr:hypothetical protein NL676_030047 [Syzygium grande]
MAADRRGAAQLVVVVCRPSTSGTWMLTVGSQLSGPHGKARLFADLTRRALSWCCLLIFVCCDEGAAHGGAEQRRAWTPRLLQIAGSKSLGHTAKRRSRIRALAGITGSLKPSWRLAKLEHNLQRKLNVTAKNVGCSLVALAMRREQIRSTDLA